MKASTKILTAYILLQIPLLTVFGINSYKQSKELKPLAEEKCRQLDQAEIKHVEVEMSEGNYMQYLNRDGVNFYSIIFFNKNYDGTLRTERIVNDCNLQDIRINGNTLYVKFVDLSPWAPLYIYSKICIPGMETYRIVLPDGVQEGEAE